MMFWTMFIVFWIILRLIRVFEIPLIPGRVIDCKRIRGGVFFIDEIPLTSSGKVLRRKVKEMAENIYNNYSYEI